MNNLKNKRNMIFAAVIPLALLTSQLSFAVKASAHSEDNCQAATSSESDNCSDDSASTSVQTAISATTTLSDLIKQLKADDEKKSEDFKKEQDNEKEVENIFQGKIDDAKEELENKADSFDKMSAVFSATKKALENTQDTKMKEKLENDLRVQFRDLIGQSIQVIISHLKVLQEKSSNSLKINSDDQKEIAAILDKEINRLNSYANNLADLDPQNPDSKEGLRNLNNKVKAGWTNEQLIEEKVIGLILIAHLNNTIDVLNQALDETASRINKILEVKNDESLSILADSLKEIQNQISDVKQATRKEKGVFAAISSDNSTDLFEKGLEGTNLVVQDIKDIGSNVSSAIVQFRSFVEDISQNLNTETSSGSVQ